jgi:hypothetical protein
MNTAKEGGPLPTKMADVVRKALDDDTHRFLSVLSLRNNLCAEYDTDIVVRLLAAELCSNVMKLVTGNCQNYPSYWPSVVLCWEGTVDR